jgi:hypothetical protein
MHNKVQLIHRWGAVAASRCASMLVDTAGRGQGNAARGVGLFAGATPAQPWPRRARWGNAAAPPGATQAAATIPKKRTGYHTAPGGRDGMVPRKQPSDQTSLELCYTEEQMAEIDRKTDAMTEDMRQRMNTHICAPNCSN